MTKPMMHRRRLILTTLGALAALPFGSQVLTNVSAVPKPKVPVAELFISVSQEVNAALTGLAAQVPPTTVTPYAKPAIGELIIHNEAEAYAFLQLMADTIRKSRPALTA